MSLLSIFCRHVWDVRVKVVAEPVARLQSGGGFSANECERLMKGATRTLCTCSRCGEIRTFVMTGVPE